MNSTGTSLGDRVGSGVMGLCFALGIPGNIMTVVFILRHFKKDNFSLHLMLNLAASDILCLMTLPVWIYYLLNGWIFGPVFCKVLFTQGTVAMNTSVFTVTLMSVQRYVTVLHRDRWAQLRRRGERVLLLSTWVLACVLSIPSALTADARAVESKLKCRRWSASDEQRLAILCFEFLLGFVVPFSILVTCYCRLHRKVNRGVFFRNPRLTKLITRIMLVFFIFSFPVYLLFPVEIVALALKSSHPHVSEKIMDFQEASANVAISLIFINSCVNPFLYAFASRKLFAGAKKPNSSGNSSQVDRVCVAQSAPQSLCD
ncbi:C-C chemokine receptor type 7-like [Sardina pilchardus]|uniref:C-C chemokine receptor type 7-like n=1 Tax=Sardina pilchardus TaxID=27697 RepID=UPI002E12C7B9